MIDLKTLQKLGFLRINALKSLQKLVFLRKREKSELFALGFEHEFTGWKCCKS